MRLGYTRLLFVFHLVIGAADAALAESQVNVAAELEHLMTQYGFKMERKHLESTREVQGRAEGIDLLPRLNALLEGFDYVIVQGPQGVERVLILGAKAPYSGPPPDDASAGTSEPDQTPEEPAAASEIVLESQRKGTSHALSLTLEGDNGQRIARVLLLDTGADFVVLPASLISQLGIQPGALRSQRVQTANGAVDAKLGTLAALWLGDQRVPGVEAAFIDDSKLGSNALLGMSVLNRFRVTIDDEQNRVVLSGK
jgi:aspartyl protease family protein